MDNVITLQKESVIPIYHQIKQQLKEQIERGLYKPGDMLPSEKELCEVLCVSRMTIKQAMDLLVNDGTIYRRKGVGTFVSESKIDQPLSKLTNFTTDMINKGMRPSSRTLSVSVLTPDEHIKEIFGFTGDEKVICLERLRLANDLPMALEKVYLDYDRCRAIENFDLTDRSLYMALADVCGIRVVRASQDIEISACTAKEGHLLGISSGLSIFYLKRRTYDENDAMIEYVESKYRSDRYKFTIELTY